MAFHTEWIYEPYILGTTFSSRVTSSELNMAMLEFLGTVQAQPTYFLMDFLNADGVPREILNIPAMLQVVNHPNTRWFVIIRPAHETSSITQLLSRDKIKTYPDHRTALGFLRGMVRLDTGKKLDPLPED